VALSRVLPEKPKPKPVTTIDEAVAQLVEEKTAKKPDSRPDWDEKTVKQAKKTATLFANVVGNQYIKNIIPEHFEHFNDVLKSMPKNYGKSSKQKSISLVQILKNAKDLPDEKKGLCPGTKNRHFSHLRALLNTAYAAVHPNCDPKQLDHLHEPDKRVASSKRKTFTNNELRTLFGADVWTNTNKSVAASLYWIPLIAVYSGMRQA
jgi:integrase